MCYSQRLKLSLRDWFGLLKNPWEAWSASLWDWSALYMKRWCEDFSFYFWGIFSLSWRRDHLCWRSLEFGLYICLMSACSSIHSSVLVIVLFLFLVLVLALLLVLLFVPVLVAVVRPSWMGALLIDDTYRGSSCVLVIIYERMCLVFGLFWLPFFCSWLIWLLVAVSIILCDLSQFMSCCCCFWCCCLIILS